MPTTSTISIKRNWRNGNRAATLKLLVDRYGFSRREARRLVADFDAGSRPQRPGA